MDDVSSHTVVIKMTPNSIIRFCYGLAFKHVLEIRVLISQIQGFGSGFGVSIGYRGFRI